jgi:Winged helix DNA-binding domain
MTQKVSIGQRRARLMSRHLLHEPARSVTEAADAMIALHGTDPTTVYLSAWARTRCAGLAEVDRALYAEREIIRMLGMRRTMFVVPAPLAPVVQRACTDDIARRLRRALERDLARGGPGGASAIGGADAAGWLRDAGEGTVRALAARGSASGAELAADEPRLRTQLLYAPDKAYGGPQNITSRVLMMLSAEGLIVRGHRRGGWSSGQFEWFPMDAWLGGPNGAVPGEAALDAAAARAELARRWLHAFGPAPTSDLQWWAGWTGTQVKAALAALPVVEVDLDGQPGVALASDIEEAPATVPPCALLLPALDPTPMGWQSREWFLGSHAPALFDRTGNIGPTAWWDGRIVGGWAQRPSGEVVFRLLEDVGAEASAAVTDEASRLQAWLGDSRVTPRFRTPLERELSA